MTISPISRAKFVEQLKKSENHGSFSESNVSSFYQWMFGDQEGYAQVCAFLMPHSSSEEGEVPSGQDAYAHTNNEQEFIDFCYEYSGTWRYQVYAGVNTLPEEPDYGRGKLDHIDAVNTFTLDIETERESHTGASHEAIWWSYKYALAQAKYINTLIDVWPMVVMSENGIHLHYKADLPIHDDLLYKRQHRCTKYLTQLAMDNKYVNTVKEQAPDHIEFSPDDVSDVPRVMKVPGTLGIKSDSGRLCGIVHKPSKEDRGCITLEDFDMEEVPEFENSNVDTNQSSNNDEDVKLESNPESVDDKVKQMVKRHCKSDDLFRAFIQGKTLTYDSRSHAEFAFIKKMLSKGYDVQQIQQVMHASKMSKWDEESDHYRQHTLENALEEFDGTVRVDSTASSMSFRTVE